jgi:hypothetical protein
VRKLKIVRYVVRSKHLKNAEYEDVLANEPEAGHGDDIFHLFGPLHSGIGCNELHRIFHQSAQGARRERGPSVRTLFALNIGGDRMAMELLNLLNLKGKMGRNRRSKRTILEVVNWLMRWGYLFKSFITSVSLTKELYEQANLVNQTNRDL